MYQNNVDGNWELYSLTLADGRPTRITDSPAAEEDPSWSPDGRWILCTVHPPSLDADPPRDICLMDREGKQSRILAAHGADDWVPRFSLDGRSVVFLSDRVDERRDVADEERQCALFQFNLDDGSLTQLSEAGRLGGPVPTARGLALRLGPHSLGWLGSTGIESALVDSTRMLGQPDWHETQGWTVSELEDNRNGRLLIRGPAESTWLALPLDGRDGDMTPVWSPDGNSLAFSGHKDGQWDLFVRRQAVPETAKP
jgi:Tol biopolymer transport system component